MDFFVTYKPVIDFFQALLAPTIGIMVAYIAFQQHRVNLYRVKLDMYEKRYAIYKHVRSLFGLAVTNGNVTYEEAKAFYANVKETEFLFDNKVTEYIDKIYKKAVRVGSIDKMLASVPTGDQRNKLVEESSSIIEWFVGELTNSSTVFKKYLSVSKI